MTTADETLRSLAKALHARYCDRACPAMSELHVGDRLWLQDARAIAKDMTRDDRRRYQLAVVLDRSTIVPEDEG